MDAEAFPVPATKILSYWDSGYLCSPMRKTWFLREIWEERMFWGCTA
jgi:hypothetical protein